VYSLSLKWPTFFGATPITVYDRGIKKERPIVHFIRKNHRSAATVTGMQRLPLLWSTTTMLRIEAILQANPK
jgi:hypothetical protein